MKKRTPTLILDLCELEFIPPWDDDPSPEGLDARAFIKTKNKKVIALFSGSFSKEIPFHKRKLS